MNTTSNAMIALLGYHCLWLDGATETPAAKQGVLREAATDIPSVYQLSPDDDNTLVINGTGDDVVGLEFRTPTPSMCVNVKNAPGKSH